MAKILSFDNKLMKIGNGLLGPAEVAPAGPSDYKLVLLSSYDFRLRGFNPNVTSGTHRNMPVNLTKINSTDSYYNVTGGEPITLVIANVSVNTLSFTYRCDIEEVGISYTLYRTVDGTDIQISSGTIPHVTSYTEYTLNLT